MNQAAEPACAFTDARALTSWAERSWASLPLGEGKKGAGNPDASASPPATRSGKNYVNHQVFRHETC